MIFPTNKEDVSNRLAFAAQRIKNIVYTGPTYEFMKIHSDKVVLSLKNVGGYLITKNGELKQFEICGAGNKYYPGEARIVNRKIIVSSGKVVSPVDVKYVWSNNPEEPIFIIKKN